MMRLPGLRPRLGAYVLALHLPLFGSATLLLPARPLWFVGAEVLVLASLALGWLLVRQALEPLGYTRRLHDLLQDQQYASRLAAPAPSAARELDDLVGTFNTMLAALHRERLAIGEQQGFLDRLLEATPSAVLVFDFDGAISLINSSALALLGLAGPKGKRLRAWADGEAAFEPGVNTARNLDLVAQLDALPLGESELLTDTGGRRFRAQRGQFFDRGFARHFLLVEELTAELERSEQATYERVIRVLAHEVNNTVAATGSVLDSLLYYSKQLTERDSVDFTTAIVAVKRRNVSLGDFIERFTRVVKMPEPELRPTSVKAMMDDILQLVREQCKASGIRIEWTRAIDAPALPMDRQLMEQALLNIIKNAMEAVQASSRDERFVHLALDAGPVLIITDSGRQLGAIPARRLFTPFFTTKRGGQGIGLVFVREVLNRHGFAYALEADGNGETAFAIRFAGARGQA